MSDPPPKKVSSLRDRIAAFENKGAAPAPGPPPAPRPKPGHITWQPKVASPPTSPKRPGTTSTGAADEAAEARKAAGMSAADAKESIGKLSLKERMAALQGSGAFGAPAGAVSPPPRPAGEKPKWKPPPVVQKVEPIGGDDDDAPSETAKDPAPEGEAAKSLQEEKEEGAQEGEVKEEGELDPEDEERQRRAALAARMARLGGARIGMAPPIFGKKPDIPPKKIHKEEPVKVEEAPEDDKPADASPVAETPEAPVVAEPTDENVPATTEGDTAGSADYFTPAKQDTTPSATLSPDSAATNTPPVRSPAMPVPQAPKRAAPPRKRPAKSPSPAPQPSIDEGLHESPAAISPTPVPVENAEKGEHPATTEATEPDTSGDREPEEAGEQKQNPAPEATSVEPPQDVETQKEATPVDTSAPEDSKEVHTSGPQILAPEHENVAEEHQEGEKSVPVIDHEESKSLVADEEFGARILDEPAHEEPETAAEPVEAPVEEPEEEDEAARRKRIAERIAKSGGFNPFGGGPPPPPVRRDSSDSARSPVASPPSLPVRRDSHQDGLARKDSVGSVRAEAAIRKDSLDGTDDHRGSVPTESSGDVDNEEGEAHAAPIEHEQSAPARESRASILEEDEESEPRGGHEDSHTHASTDEEPERGSEEAYEGPHDYLHGHERQAEPEEVEDEVVPAVPHHPPPHVPRPLPTAPITQEEEAETKTAPSPAALPPPPPKRQSIPPPPKRQSVPPPPRVAPAPPVDEYAEEERASSLEPEEENVYARHARDVGPKHEVEEQGYSPREEDALHYESGHYAHDGHLTKVEEVEAVVAPPPPPPPRHTSVSVPPVLSHDEDEDEIDEDDFDAPPPPPPPRRTSVNIPAPPAHVQSHDDDKGEYVEEDEELEEPVLEERIEAEAAPPPPPSRSTRPTSPISTGAPRRPIPPPLRPPSPAREDEGELLNESDVDPIDPEFYSPQKSPGPDGKAFSPSPLQSFSVPAASPPPPPPARLVSPPPVDVPSPPPQHVVSSPPPPPQRVISPPPAPTERATSPTSAHDQEEPKDQDNGEDSEQARRRTIAERMAKLGGIRFGAPPPVPTARRAPPPSETEHEGGDDSSELEKPAEAEEVAPEEEEDEFARKQRIAARIAGMGGMRFGMLPGAAPPVPRPPVRRGSQDDGSQVKSPPPKRSAPIPAPPPPPPTHEEEEHGEESDFQHVSDSERVAQEESELEEVTHSDAEEAPPPPVPDRGARRVSTGPPPVPQARPLSPPSLASPPPVPRTRPPPPPSFTYPPPPPPAPTTHESQGDFVIVEQGEDVDEPLPPPPPPRAARPPPRGHGVPLPPPPPPAAPGAPGASDAQWDQPSIPSVDFGGEADLSLSGQWSEDSTNYPPPPPPGRSSASVAAGAPSQQAHNVPAVTPVAEQHLTPDELMAHWGRVGVQAHEVAAALFERSKKGVVGDGSYLGFVNTVLGQVPTATQPAPPYETFGYLVYSQSAAAVQRRVSDIMPGDVFVAHEAKFKGHKGLQSYHQHVGVGQPLLAVIGDFEAKKSKVKVYQANQHVGQQSVELASYRLEDLKSGSVKVFRVLEA